MSVKRFFQDKTRPKKASELINTKSHNQKKYISLMVVPSYTTGKTRSLKIPRIMFHGTIFTLIIIGLIVFGGYLSSAYFARIASNLSGALDETKEAFTNFQLTSEEEINSILESSVQMYENFSEEQNRVLNERNNLLKGHQEELESIWGHIETIEQLIGEIEEEQRELINNLGARGEIIPPIVTILNELKNAQEEIRFLSDYNRRQSIYETGAASVGLMSTRMSVEEELLNHVMFLLDELELQQMLLDNIRHYGNRMEVYLHNFPTLWPLCLEVGQVTSGFGWRANALGGSGSEHHSGIDIAAPTGTPIRATGGGVVQFVGWMNGYGNTVIINHGNGITTLYAHNQINKVYEGQTITRGEIIALVGSTGRSTAPHLHYEVLINGVAQNPTPFLSEFYE